MYLFCKEVVNIFQKLLILDFEELMEFFLNFFEFFRLKSLVSFDNLLVAVLCLTISLQDWKPQAQWNLFIMGQI